MLKNLRNRLNDNKGFSLVELIVVIAIMVILIAILVPNITGYINKSRDVSKSATAKSIYDAAYAYQTELIGQNKIGDSKTVGTIEGALKDDDSIYKIDLSGEQTLSTGSTPGGDEDFALDVDSSTGKIYVYYTSAVDPEKTLRYPAETSES